MSQVTTPFSDRMTRLRTKKLGYSSLFSSRNHCYEEDKLYFNSQDDNRSTTMSLDEDHFFSDTNDQTNYESDTLPYEKICVLKNKSKKIRKQKSQNQKRQNQEEILNTNFTSDNDKASDDETIKYAIKHVFSSLQKSIEEEKEIKLQKQVEEHMFSTSSSEEETLQQQISMINDEEQEDQEEEERSENDIEIEQIQKKQNQQVQLRNRKRSQRYNEYSNKNNNQNKGMVLRKKQKSNSIQQYTKQTKAKNPSKKHNK